MIQLERYCVVIYKSNKFGHDKTSCWTVNQTLVRSRLTVYSMIVKAHRMVKRLTL